MTSDPGLSYGLAFFALLCTVMVLVFRARHRAERRAWETAHPVVPGSGEALLSRLAALATPTLLLVPADSARFSKLGGAPELPSGLAKPQGWETHAFLVQVDFAEIRDAMTIDWLPANGRLYAFCDPDGAGASSQVRILHSAGERSPDPPLGSHPSYRERRIKFEPFVSFPSAEWLGFEGRIDMDADDFEARLDVLGVRPPGEDQLHRIGGYPDEIQNGCLRLECEHAARGLPVPVYGQAIPPEIEAASCEWRLLLQIDSDPDLGIEFGDAGRLYVFIRERDARAEAFSDTVTLYQCY